MTAGAVSWCACTSACAPDPPTHFGQPNALAGTDPSDLFDDGRGAADASADGDASCGPPASGDAAAPDGAPCPTFAGSVYATIVVGRGCASATCHGGTTKPLIDGADADRAYAELTRDVRVAGKPYVDACSRDPSASAFPCNTTSSGTCGQIMPLATTGLSADDEALVRTWLACGAPLR